MGYYPKGGGRISLEVEPAGKLSPLNLVERGSLISLEGSSIVSNLNVEIAQRMKTRLLKNISEASVRVTPKIIVQDFPAASEGAVIFLCAKYSNCIAGFSSIGERAKPAEKVAGSLAHEFTEFNKTSACVDPHLADQLLLYCALAEGKSRFLTSQATGQ